MVDVFLETFVLYSKAILPWLIFGMVLGMVVEKKVRRSWIREYFGKFSLGKLVMAQVLGMLSPLSIMSFIPIAAELGAMGASPGLLFSFFIAERAYDLQAFLIVGSLFGWRVAVINVVTIFVALVVTAIYLKRRPIEFSYKEKRKKKDGFWMRQVRLLLTVGVGIVIGASLKVMVPEGVFSGIAGSDWGGTLSALVMGFSFYFGPLLGNYPVIKAFADLGMSQMGVLTFLSVSPVFNFVIIMMFSGLVGVKETVKPVAIYAIVSLVLSVGLGMLF